MGRALLLQVGSTVPALIPSRGDFDRWFLAGLDPLEVDVVRPHLGEPLPSAGSHAGIVITGSSAMVTDAEPWSLAIEARLKEEVYAGTHILGVCYGHQLLARALDGEAGWNGRGREIGTVEVQLTEEARGDVLFGRLASPLVVQESHSQSVLVLPPGARRLGHNKMDDNQVFAFGDQAWGMQFHPEFDAEIVRGYIEGRRDKLAEEGLDPEELLETTRDSDIGLRVLKRFSALVRAR